MILLQGSAEMVPLALFDQLKSGGRLVGVLGRGPAGKAMLYRRVEGDIQRPSGVRRRGRRRCRVLPSRQNSYF